MMKDPPSMSLLGRTSRFSHFPPCSKMALAMAVASAAGPSKSKTVFNRSATRIPLISSSSLYSSSKAHLLLSPHHHLHNALHLPSLSWSSKEQLQIPYRARVRASASSSTENRQVQEEQAVFHGQCYVLGDNIDTDQIIPAEHLTLVPSKPGEYEKLGSLALIGLPSHHPRFVEGNQTKSRYSIVIAGSNFGCGSSREHAPVALGASGVKAVVAESYARIFFRNSVSTGEIYPLESEGGSSRLCEECSTGDFVTVELASNKLINHTTGKEYGLKPIGDAGPVIGAGGIFAYARKTGMIASAST